MKAQTQHARLVRQAERFPLKIADVIEFDQLDDLFPKKGNVTLATVSKTNLDAIVTRTCSHAKRGEVVFFLSRDRQRARAVVVLTRRPPCYAVSFLSFGNLTPELVISIWLAQQLGVTRQRALEHVLSEGGRRIAPLETVQNG